MGIIKTSTTPQVVVNDFHKAVYAAACVGHKATQSMQSKMAQLIAAKYGKTAPTFEQYRDDQAALKQLAKDRGLSDNQWLRKPYAAAVKAAYGALPVSMAPSAVLKRQEREQAAAKAAPAPAVGAPKGEPQERAPSDSEQLEAIIARIGLFKTLEACTRILASDKTTAGQAAHLKAVATKAAKLVAEAANRPPTAIQAAMDKARKAA